MTSNNMKTPIFFLFLFFLSFSAISQKIDTATYNGKTYFIYPFKNTIQPHNYYYSFFDFSKNKKVMLKMLKETTWKNFSEADLKIFEKKYLKELKYFDRLTKKSATKIDKELKHIVLSNPSPLIECDYTYNFDVNPCLDNIPDGKYIQYFQDFGLLDLDRNYLIVEKKISGFFTIKNNLLDGEALWFNYEGDTLKKGQFKNGLKEGTWFLENRNIKLQTQTQKQNYLKNGVPDIDTTIEITFFKQGVKDGFYSKKEESDYPSIIGNYADNEESGHWQERETQLRNNVFTKIERMQNQQELRHNNVITAEYTYSAKKVIVKQPLVRNGLILPNYVEGFNFEYDYSPNAIPKEYFSIAFEQKPELDIEEEKINSYEGDDYETEYPEEEYMEDGEYYPEEYYEEGGDYGYRTVYVYDEKNDKSIERSKAIDSLGLTFLFDGKYERHYPNGQLMFQYDFVNGKLVKEDTIFWDNGKPYDIVTYHPDSAIFIQSVYDYDGKLYNELVFDASGNFKRVNFEPELTKYAVIEGLTIVDNENINAYYYDVTDTLGTVIVADSILLSKVWNKNDTTIWSDKVYFPKDRILKTTSYSMNGKKAFQSDLVFNPDYKSYTGTETHIIENLSLKTKKSASYTNSTYDFYDNLYDSIPQLLIGQSEYMFDITADNTICLNNGPFSGPVSVTLNTNKIKFKTKNGLDIFLPLYASYAPKLEKDYANYRLKGKAKFPLLLNVINQSQIYENYANLFCNVFFSFLGNEITYPSIDFYQGFEYDQDIYEEFDETEEYIDAKQDEDKPAKQKKFKYDEKNYIASAKQINGNLKAGKPEGIWEIKDQFGNVQTSIPFLNGEMNGMVKQYSYIEGKPNAKSKKTNDYEGEYYDEYEGNNGPAFMYDSVPKRKTNYLSSIGNYKNGLASGSFTAYNWLGEIQSSENYVEGYQEGPAFQRNKLAHTKENYHLGELDGYVQTFLTLPGKDSVLLYNLNYQNGLLQGESRSYHINGKLSKKGFFLNGEPIDDYEAYDSLGFKYHYVKFLYSFPVEEKIWEENELSVRYLFDWKDSIEFTPSDITTSQSLDRILAGLGIGMNNYYEPYFGRPSLVDKTGIKYNMTRYYPNNAVARDGQISLGKKVGLWKFYSYEGEFLYEVKYADSIITLNDSIQFKSKGVLRDYDSKGKMISQSYIIEKFEKYDCSHTDHYEIRQLYTFWEANDSLKLRNGYVKNHYDNGVLQNEGKMVDGLPSGIWKFYDPFGNLNQVGVYVQGKRDGRWLGGDISKTKYLGDICLNPNLPDLEKEIKMREQQLDIIITNYKLGKALNKEFYDINWGEFEEIEEK